MLVSAPLAHQRKLVEGADKSTTHHAKTDSRLDSLPLPAPAEQTQRAEAGGEEWKGGGGWGLDQRLCDRSGRKVPSGISECWRKPLSNDSGNAG